MVKSKVAILRTTPATAIRDDHSVLNLAGCQDVVRERRRHRAQGQPLVALLLPRQIDC